MCKENTEMKFESDSVTVKVNLKRHLDTIYISEKIEYYPFHNQSITAHIIMALYTLSDFYSLLLVSLWMQAKNKRIQGKHVLVHSQSLTPGSLLPPTVSFPV